MSVVYRLSTKRQKVLTEDDFSDKDVIFITYYADWPEDLTDDMLTALYNYVNDGGNIIFATHGWVWGAYG